MGKINILTKDIYNRIAAGEVIERPYSAVKELIENSLDAGANEISVYIENGGRQLIKVCDNGCGIESDDMRKAFIPHATSKVASVDDLDEITTLGFRGEALASISSISRTEITSVTKGNQACRVVSEDGYIGKVEPAALDCGTEVAVHDLFYNTPVRAKFLKSEKAEESDIRNFVSRYILGNPDVSFRYFCDGKLKLQSFGNGLDEAVAQVYGAKVISECFKLKAEKNGIKIHGFIGNQNFFKPNKSYQSLFLNGRYIANGIISSAITNAYASYAMKRQYPFYVLFVDVPHDMVDVNVHPNKSDVRFTDGRAIYSAVYSVISGVLDGTARATDFVIDYARLPEVKSTAEQVAMPSQGMAAGMPEPIKTVGSVFAAKTESAAEKPENIDKKDADSLSGKRIFALDFVQSQAAVEKPGSTAPAKGLSGAEKPCQAAADAQPATEKPNYSVPDEKLFKEEDSFNADKHRGEKTVYDDYAAPEFVDREKDYPVYAYYSALKKRNTMSVSAPGIEMQSAPTAEELEQKHKAEQEKFICRSYTYKGNLFNTYLLYEIGSDVYIIDQHAAHERLIYNKLKAEIADRNVPRQGLLLPYTFSLSPEESSFIDENIEIIRGMGFDLEPFGINSYRINEVPVDLKDLDFKAFFDELLSDLVGLKAVKMEEILKDKIAMTACKHAVKGGMELTRQEADELLEAMHGDMGMKCPHGRPVAVKLTKSQIEKMFKRIV